MFQHGFTLAFGPLKSKEKVADVEQKKKRVKKMRESNPAFEIKI